MSTEATENPFDKMARYSRDRERRVENIKILTHEVEVGKKRLLEKEQALQQEINAKVGLETKMSKVAQELK